MVSMPIRWKNLGELVDKDDIEVALTIFDHLCCLRPVDAAGLVCPVMENTFVEEVNDFRCFLIGSGDDFLNFGQRMLFIAWIDACRAVATERDLIGLQGAEFLQHRHIFFFGVSGIDSALMHHNLHNLETSVTYIPRGFLTKVTSEIDIMIDQISKSGLMF